MDNKVDIKENYIKKIDPEILEILLMDHSSKRNIIWATDNYSEKGIGFQSYDEIKIDNITGRNGNVIKPRTEKSKEEQDIRIRKKAEVFTPSWICNVQNNLIDDEWFGIKNVFNFEKEKTWTTNYEKVKFPTDSRKTWQEYVMDTRLEISCGEAPYIASRYDTVNGEIIPVKNRIGILDRKLRIVSENNNSKIEWHKWAKKAFQSTYGYEWQGDNIILARENLLFTYVDYYSFKFNIFPPKKNILEISKIVSWNIWQMDGMKYVIPESCKSSEIESIEMKINGTDIQLDSSYDHRLCIGCLQNNPYNHTGIYCVIKDWENNKTLKFVSVIND